MNITRTRCTGDKVGDVEARKQAAWDRWASAGVGVGVLTGKLWDTTPADRAPVLRALKAAYRIEANALKAAKLFR